MKAVIIGGGIIGLCSAWYLQKEGWEVTVLDKGNLEDNCSFGNAGMIVPSHFVPLASPGIVAKGIKWMFDSKSPFYVKLALSRRLAGWGIQFIRHANQKHADRSAPYLRDLNLLSSHLYQELATQPGFDFALEQKGIMMYYKTPQAEDEELHLAETARSLGLDASPLTAAEAQQLEPEVHLDVAGAVHYCCDAHLYPNKLMAQLVAAIKANGGVIKTNAEVSKIDTANGMIQNMHTENGSFTADLFVIAGGSWLQEIAKLAGLHIPLMPGKGYSITEEKPAVKLAIPAILCEAKVAITPMDGRMRYGGTMEIADINSNINLSRVQGIIESIPKYFPNLQPAMPALKDIWCGFRPCSPDGMPYIGRSKKLSNAIIAGGHSMMGLSLGPATGKLVAELANEQPLSVRTDAFDPGRFS
ncbi:MAG: FAD-dependent oxidoreductase [Chitinophagaceae bacterium]